MENLIQYVENNRSHKAFLVWEHGKEDDEKFDLITPKGKLSSLEKKLFGDIQEAPYSDSRFSEIQIEKYISLIKEWAQTVLDKNRQQVEWSTKRLTFYRDIIERLGESDAFIIHCEDGDFQMTKGQFDTEFGNVAASGDYKNRGVYSYPTTPQKALQFRIN